MSLISRAMLAGALTLPATGYAQDVKPVGGSKPAADRTVADPFASIPAAKPEDVRSADAIVNAFYQVISGGAGVKRDWDRFRSLFYPGARMIPTGRNAKTGNIGARIASPEDYVRANQAFLEGEGFHEVELSRSTDAFGGMAHVYSAYEARNKLSDPKPFLRGINSMQLLNDGKRWWIMTVAWAPETAEHPLPAKYTKKIER